MTNYGFEHALGERGIGFVRAKVGDRYVHQALVEHGGVLGGEASGHLLCLDRASTGDGIVSALQVLEVLRRRGIACARRWPACARCRRRPSTCAMTAARKPAEAASRAGGAGRTRSAAVEGRGRAFLRPSGTEPVVRVTVEADDAALMQSTLDRTGRRRARGRAIIQRPRADCGNDPDTNREHASRIPTLDIRRFTHPTARPTATPSSPNSAPPIASGASPASAATASRRR